MGKKDLTLIVRARNLLRRGLKSAGASIKAFGHSVMRLGRNMALAFAGAATGLVAAMVKAQEFNMQIGQIATLTNQTAREVGKAVRGMSAEFGLAKEELTKGLYDALSAGVPADNVFDFMKTAAKAAKAGAAGVAVAVEATTRIMDAYGEAAGSATNINDKLFTAVKYGVITYEQLAEKIGSVAGVAEKAGIPFDDLLATIATASKTVNAEQLFTGIRAAIMSMAKTAEGSRLMIDKGLGGALDEVARATGGTLFGLRNVITEARALPVVLAVSGKNAEKFTENLDNMSDSAGNMMDAFGKMESTNPLSKLQKALENIMLTAGDAALQALAPTIERAARAAAEFAENIADWMSDDKIKRVRDQIQGVVDALIGGSESRGEMVEQLGNVVVAYFQVGAEKAVSILEKAAPVLGKLLGAAVSMVWKTLVGGSSRESKDEAARQLYDEGKISSSGVKAEANKIFGELFGVYGESKEETENRRKLLSLRALEIDQAQVLKDLGIASIDVVDGQTAAEKKLALEKAKLSALSEKGRASTAEAERISALIAEAAAEYAAWAAAYEARGGTKVPPSSDFQELSEEELKAIEAAKKKKLALEKKFHADLAKLQEEKRAAEERDAKDALDWIDEKIEKQKELAGITVKEFIAKANQQKAVDKQQQDDSDRVKKIRAKEARGIKVSRQDKEFLNAFNAIELANKELVKLKAERAAAEKVVESRAKKQLRATEEISSAIVKLKASMEAIMKGG